MLDFIYINLPIIPLFKLLISCCSLLWTTKSKIGNYNYRFIVTGGAIMQMVEILRQAFSETGGYEIC